MVARAGQQVGGAAEQARRGRRVVRGPGRPGHGVAVGHRGEIHRYAAVRPLGFVRQTPVDEGVVDLLGDRLRVGDTTLQAPGPAIHAAVARIHEVVQGDELARDVVEVRRDGLAELGQPVCAVRAVAEIAQDLVEGAVLLDDVDDVLDVLAQKRHDPAVVIGAPAVEIVLGDRLGEALEIPLRRHRGADQRSLLELELVLVRGPGGRGGCGVAARIGDAGDRGRGAGEVPGVGPGDALAVDDVHEAAVGAQRDVVRFVGGRDQAADLVVALAVALAAERDDRDRIGAGVDRVEGLAIGRERHGEGGGAGVSRALVAVVVRRRGQGPLRGARVDLRDHGVGRGVDHRDLVGVVLRHEQLRTCRIERHAERVAVERDALDQTTRVAELMSITSTSRLRSDETYAVLLPFTTTAKGKVPPTPPLVPSLPAE